MSGDVTNHASTSRAPGPDIEAEIDMGGASDNPPIEDAYRLSAINLEVESAMNHWRHRAVLRDACFSQRHLMPSILERHTSELLKMV